MSDDERAHGQRHEAWNLADGDAPRPEVRRRALAAALGALAEPAPAKSAAPRLRRWVLPAASAVAVAASVTVFVGRGGGGPARGEITADARVDVSVGARARVALEPGTQIAWSSPEDVSQSSGSAFYRVEPGAPFHVHTPAGDVTVLGTCFRVKVRSATGETNMNVRDLKAGLVGATSAVVAFVGVYEGKVSASHAGQTVELTSGEAADLRSGSGPRKEADGSGAERAFDARATIPGADQALSSANQNLVRQVGEYRTRLEGIAAEKADLEDKLKKTEQELAASGSRPPSKKDFDPSPEEWGELAKTGSVKYTTPCFGTRSKPWSPSDADLDRAGLAPSDRRAVETAYAHATEQMSATIMPLCAAVVGSAEAAAKLGLEACRQAVLDAEDARDPRAAFRARQLVGEIRAGARPMPSPNDPLNPVAKVYLALTGSTKALEAELAQSFGPAEAHRLVGADGMCIGTHSHSSDVPPDK